MSTDDSPTPLETTRAELEAEIPDDLTISRVTYEGPELVI
jgi:predicted metal-dependent RNase